MEEGVEDGSRFEEERIFFIRRRGKELGRRREQLNNKRLLLIKNIFYNTPLNLIIGVKPQLKPIPV